MHLVLQEGEATIYSYTVYDDIYMFQRHKFSEGKYTVSEVTHHKVLSLLST